ncbi:hypothetical protein [uncultured Sulfitobacter sp.]|uniref:hypothetical protein n=1 Tax=uncultured Sulfitobacter sp. TaxID=191468 RepID=UPI0025931EE3|nr:hypothetical protein [uncultured Sulfitobacter sp.]
MPHDRDPDQLRVVKALAEHVEGINPEQDDCDVEYDFDLTDRVYRGRSVITAEDAESAVSILEAAQNYNVPETEPNFGHGQVLLLVQGWPEDDKEHPSDPAYRLMAEVRQRLSMIVQEKDNGRGPLYPDIHLLGGEITSLKIGQGVVRPPEDGVSRLAMFFIPVLVKFKMDHSDPWAQ